MKKTFINLWVLCDFAVNFSISATPWLFIYFPIRDVPRQQASIAHFPLTVK